jgi:short-subunit dehydrogenase
MSHDRKLQIAITGASRGIGAAIARSLSTSHNVVLVGRDMQALQEVARDMHPDSFRIMQCDMTSQTSVSQLCEQIGPIDVLINNAGVAEFGSAAAMPYDAARRQIETNLLGPIQLIGKLIPGMVERGKGMVITINSVAATTVFSGAAAYSASKAGMLAYTRSMRQDVRQYGVKVTDVFVGATETEIWSEESRVNFGHRMMTATHVSDMVAHLVSTFDDDRSMIEEVTMRPQLGDL